MPDPLIDVPPENPNFPDPRPKNKRPKLEAGLSIDAILQRTNPARKPSERLADLGIEDCFASLESEDAALREEERRLARLRAETFERIRVVRESEVLIEAREKVLDEREAVLAKRLASTLPDQNLAELDNALKAARLSLREANQSLSEKEKLIASLQSEIEELKAARPTTELTEEDDDSISYEQVTHRSLAEQVAFLKEREAFIEQSENTLFDKAQHLQEWEIRLQQMEHDQSSSSNSGKTRSDLLGDSLGDSLGTGTRDSLGTGTMPEEAEKDRMNPIQFPRAAASGE